MNKRQLTFRKDGTFKIVQLTDMHFGDGTGEDREADDRTAALVERVLEAERPDLVVLTGDMNWSEGVADPEAACRRALAPIIRSGLPWAAVFGNHDAEETVSREQLLAIQQENEQCLSSAGPDHIHGVGNYSLTVNKRDGSAGAALYFLDSGDYAPESIGGFGWVHPDQIHWYTEQSAQYTLQNGGTPLPSLAFFHIPFPEYEEAWSGEDVTGEHGETVGCAKINSGLFGAMIEMGDVIGTFVGHDHDNDYCGTLHGIRLCYGRSTGFNAYGKLERGARVIELKEGSRTFDTWIVQADGKIVR